jgi:O-acetyl-ADP-ribose deacetylase (regulator of RNase III)
LKLILTAPNPALFAAFELHFANFADVEVVNTGFEWIPYYDCLVSPANSFGLMDGGIDAAITRFFGLSLERQVQQHILQEYLGEQPVGTSFIIATGHPQHPWLAHTPTMRIPMAIKGTDIPYTAMWATLLAVRQHNLHHPDAPIRTLACPGLGTGIGQVPPAEAARLMALAYDHFLYPTPVINTFVAASRQLQIWEG